MIATTIFIIRPGVAFATARVYSGNWSGNIATGGGYQWVSAEWEVPEAGNVPGVVSAWVGIGGSSGNPLVQAGTDSKYRKVCTDTPCNPYEPIGKSYWFWIEDTAYCPGGTCTHIYKPHTTLDLAAHDRVRVYVSSGYSPDASNQVYFRIENLTRGGAYIDRESWPLANTGTAEWIVEKPEATWPPVINSGTTPPKITTFYNAMTGRNGTTQYVGQTTHDYDVLTNTGNSTGTVLAEPGWISCNKTNFAVYQGVAPDTACSGPPAEAATCRVNPGYANCDGKNFIQQVCNDYPQTGLVNDSYVTVTLHWSTNCQSNWTTAHVKTEAYVIKTLKVERQDPHAPNNMTMQPWNRADFTQLIWSPNYLARGCAWYGPPDTQITYGPACTAWR
jgi:hypothetical protein